MNLNTVVKGKYFVFCKLLVILLVAGGFWLSSTSDTASPAASSSALADVAQETHEVAVKTYAPEAKAKLKLPAAVQQSSTKQVLTATDLAASKHERTVSTVLDLETGEAIQYVTQKELPWLGGASDTRFGIYAGVKQSSHYTEPAVRVTVSKDLLAVKSTNVVLHGSIDFTNSGRTDAFIGVGVEF